MKTNVRLLSAVALVLLLALPAAAQAPAAPATVPTGVGEEMSLPIRKMRWVVSDMVRCIEEMRRAKDPASRRYLADQVEELVYREVEFPLLYQQADNASKLDVAPIGAVSDVAEAGEASPLATLYAEAFALAGIARGYEGFAAAGTDYIERAEAIYSDVLSLPVKIDSFQDAKPLSQWLADARGRWGANLPLRVTFYGKAVSQEVVDGLGLENVSFRTTDRDVDYYLYAAKRDFLKGMRRRIATDDVLKARRINQFSIYLPPGKYTIHTGVSGEYGSEIEVFTNPDRNHYLIETIEDGIAIFPVPDLKALREDLKKQEQAPVEGSGLGTGLPPEPEDVPAEGGAGPAPADEGEAPPADGPSDGGEDGAP